MRIRINSPTTFVITEQSDKYFTTYYYHSSIGEIEVAKSCYPEVRYLGYKTLLFVRGMYHNENYKMLQVDKPEHLPHMLNALKEFCTFNEEPFEIESCTL